MMKFKTKPKDGKVIETFHDESQNPKNRLNAFLQSKDRKNGENFPNFIREHYSTIMYLISQSFWTYKENMQFKKKKVHVEETDLMDIILPSLENILQYLPDKINNLWHYHSIASILQALLENSENLVTSSFILGLRKKAITLTILWFLGLLDNYDNAARAIFKLLVKEFHEADKNMETNTDYVVPLFQHLLESLTCNAPRVTVRSPSGRPSSRSDDESTGSRSVASSDRPRHTPRHSTPRSIPTCVHRCPVNHRQDECPKQIVEDVTRRLLAATSRPVNPFFSGIEDLLNEIIKWFLKQAKNILPHSEKYCMFMKMEQSEGVAEGALHKDKEFDQRVKVCEIIDRVLFTDRRNANLMNDAFHTFTLQSQDKDRLEFLMSEDEEQELSFPKMLTLYYELIMNIKQYNVSSANHRSNENPSQVICPEFLSDNSDKKKNKERTVSKRIRAFLKDTIFNVSPLLIYPAFYNDSLPFLTKELRKKIERVAQYTMGIYLAIIQKIEQADPTTCFTIITCIIKSIECNNQRGIHFQHYKTHLEHLLNIVTFVGRKVTLPRETWEELQKLLKQLEKEDKAHDIWTTALKNITSEISLLVFNMNLNEKLLGERTDKPAKKKLPANFPEERYQFTQIKKAYAKVAKLTHHIKTNQKHSKYNKGSQEHERKEHYPCYHYHGRNTVFIASTNDRNKNPDHDDIEEDDDLRKNDGEHPIALWQKMISLKGSPNNEENPIYRKKMFESLACILDLLLCIDNHKEGLKQKSYPKPKYKQIVSDHPVQTYIYHILPWFFEAHLTESDNRTESKYIEAEKESLRMICKCIIRHCPIKPPERIPGTKRDLLHQAVIGCKNIFAVNLKGCICLSPKLFTATRFILNKEFAHGPKMESLELLGSLYSLPWTEEITKTNIVTKIMEVAKCDSNQSCRSRSLGILGCMIHYLLSENDYTARIDTGPPSPSQILDSVETKSENKEKRNSETLIALIRTCLLQVRSENSLVAISALAVIRDLTGYHSKLLVCDPNFPNYVIENLLAALSSHRTSMSDEMDHFPMKSSSPTYSANGQATNHFVTDPHAHQPSVKEYKEAVIANIIIAITEWMLDMSNIPFFRPNETTLKIAFKAIQLISLNESVTPLVIQYEKEQRLALTREQIQEMKQSDVNLDSMNVEGSIVRLPGSQPDGIAASAEMCLHILCQYYEQFPICGGPDYSSSMVFEFPTVKKNDCYRDELQLFDKQKDVQLVTMGKKTVTSIIEISDIPSVAEPLFELPFLSHPGCSRIIFRNIAGRFSWTGKRLYGLKDPPDSPQPLLELVDQTEEEPEAAEKQYNTLTPLTKDLLNKAFDRIRDTSRELEFYRNRPVVLEDRENGYGITANLLKQQSHNEERFDNDQAVITDPTDNLNVTGDITPGYNKHIPYTSPSPFFHSRSNVSFMKMLSWDKRKPESERRVELLRSNNNAVESAVGEFDERLNREVFKFGVVYIAKGQESKEEIFRNDHGSREYEEFLSGLGWEVSWQAHQGYAPILVGKSSMSTTIHYATPTLETVFHVSTRLDCKNQNAYLDKWKYIGNDYVVVLWSEHDRDIKNDDFKSSYLDVKIVIYPNDEVKKCRVQIIVKDGKLEPFIGPLFDGALVSHDILPELIRKTCINAYRVIAVTQKRPKFYVDRCLARDKLSNYKEECSFEKLAMELTSPSLYDFSRFHDFVKLEPSQIPRSNSKVIRPRTRTSQGYISSQDNSEGERSSRSKFTRKTQQSDSDTSYHRR